MFKLPILTITIQRETLKDLVQLAVKNGDNNFIPEYIPDNLPWYETDVLLTYNEFRCEELLQDPNKHFKENKNT